MTIHDRPSPHHSERREPVTAIVLHDTGGKTAESALSWFEAPESKVSAHYVIGTDGQTWRCVPDDRVAWHAGVSSLHGRAHVNGYSLGVEIVDADDSTPYPDAQLDAIIELLSDLCWAHKVPLNRVVGHADIALPPGRKVDPNRDFPIYEVLACVGAHLATRLK